MSDAEPVLLLQAWLKRQAAADAMNWLQGRLEDLRASPSLRDLQIAMGLAPRKLGKDDLQLSESDLADASAARRGWDPRGWTVDEAARVLALLAFGTAAPQDLARTFVQLCRTADVGEAVALYRGLPLYPDQEQLEGQAAEGLRSNMRAVFEAVAHRSPYPRERFGRDRWNQMILKALFVGSALAPIQGLDERANAELAAILRDYAHERWAAGRPVSPELWRCVGPFAEGDMLADLERVARSSDPRERAAAALALSASGAPGTKELLALLPDEAAAIRSGSLTWDTLESSIGQEETA